MLLDILVENKYIENLGSSRKRLVRGAAAVALGKIGDKRAVEPLVKILEDDDALYRKAAIALADLGDKRAIEPLKKRMEEKKDEEWIMKDLNAAYRKLTQKNGGKQQGMSPILSGEEGRKSLEIILAIYKSLKSGQPVKLSL